MSFLKPNLGRREAAPPPARPRLHHGLVATADAAGAPAWLAEERARLEGVLAAELERYESSVLEALADLEQRHAALEREHAEAQRKLQALRDLLDEAFP